MDLPGLHNYFSTVNYSYKASNSIINTMTNEFHRFIENLFLVDDLAIDKELLIDECASLCKIINEYQSGKVFHSYHIFNTLIKELDKYIDNIVVNEKSPEKFINTDFYRMRKSDVKITTKEEIFHISLKNRNKVRTQRYSIPGLPCLYLSGSVYACWDEMNRPPIHELYVSRYNLSTDQSYRILNLSIIDPIRMFSTHTENFDPNTITTRNDEIKSSLIMLWPLLFACSLFGSTEEDSYKPEYIIPQFLLQWSKSIKKIDGICYLSVDIDKSIIDPLLCLNYVFPIKDYNTPNYCSKLISFFYLTDPIRCDIIENIMKGYYGRNPGYGQRPFLSNDNRRFEYEDTIFGLIENYLHTIEPTQIRIKKEES